PSRLRRRAHARGPPELLNTEDRGPLQPLERDEGTPSWYNSGLCSVCAFLLLAAPRFGEVLRACGPHQDQPGSYPVIRLPISRPIRTNRIYHSACPTQIKAFFAASRQLASVTPKCSSITSDRRKPGVSASTVTFLRRSSRAMANAMRITLVFTRS